MKPSLILLVLLAAFGLAACVEPETYPLTGEECGPDDPIQEMTGDGCVSPTGTGI